MTTIAYKDGIIAYDSRATRGDIIDSDDVRKAIKINGVTFILSGRQDHIDAIKRAWFDDEAGKDIDAYGLVIDEKGFLWECNYDKALIKIKFDYDSVCAFGTGCLHALTAMDMGATAAEAVKMAIKRDVYTGGKVRTIKL